MLLIGSLRSCATLFPPHMEGELILRVNLTAVRPVVSFGSLVTLYPMARSRHPYNVWFSIGFPQRSETDIGPSSPSFSATTLNIFNRAIMPWSLRSQGHGNRYARRIALHITMIFDAMLFTDD
jgi:hypothetical protein